jgi:hypothetical protein
MSGKTVPVRVDEKLIPPAKKLIASLKDKYDRPKYPNLSRLTSAALEEFLITHTKEGPR